MTAPRVEIDLDKIQHNARSLVHRLGQRGIGVTGVTKAVCGHPDIARAMLHGGITGLADARIENVIRMRHAGIDCPASLIRTPMLSQVDQVTQECGTSFNTELDTIHMLAKSARLGNKTHGVILMVEMGDLREGVMPGDLEDLARKVKTIPGIVLKGIGANFACLGKTAPNHQAMADLSFLADRIDAAGGRPLIVVSGGNSTNLPWAFGEHGIGRINDLRLGEAIMLGVDPISGIQIDGLFTDAFTLVAEVIESKTNPMPECIRSMPKPKPLMQSILAIGYQDTDAKGLTLPLGLTMIGATSDHLVISTGSSGMAIGAEVALQPNYNALMRVMNAPGVGQVIKRPKTLEIGTSTELLGSGPNRYNQEWNQNEHFITVRSTNTRSGCPKKAILPTLPSNI